MAWVATFTNDTALNGVGTIRADFFAPNGEVILHVEDRVDSKSGAVAFVTKAKNLLAAKQAEKQSADNISQQITAALNG